jgi:putative ABC transport system permease protein
MKYLFRSIMRSFTRKPVTNLINLFGLAISLTLVIILSVYCYSELSTDSFQKNGKRVYLYGLGSVNHVYTPGILKEHIDANVPGVETTVRIGGTWEAPVFQVDNKEPIVSDLIFADKGFFKLFTYNFIEGNAESALDEPMSVIITKTLSRKLFGNKEALGKTIKLNNSQSLTVSAVVEEPDANSCLNFNALSNIATRKIVMDNEGEYTEWGWCDFQTFLLLKPEVNPD